MKKISEFLSLAALVLVMFSFCGCDRPDPTSGIVIKGKINTFLDPCHGCCWVVDVKTPKDLYVKNGTYKCPACNSFSVSYDNSIAIPYFNDVETGELTYTGEGAEWLQFLHVGVSSNNGMPTCNPRGRLSFYVRHGLHKRPYSRRFAEICRGKNH